MKKTLLALYSVLLLTACQTQTVTEVKEPPVETPAPLENNVNASEPVANKNLVEKAIEGTKIVQNYSVDSLGGVTFTLLDKGSVVFMNKKALGQLYVNEEIIESFYAPEHPTNKNIVFLSTSKSTDDKYGPDMKVENRIYAYHLDTGELNLLYKETEQHLLRTLGMEGSKLILMAAGIDNSPGPCASVWYENYTYETLELADIEAGLMPYTVPEYQLEIGKAEQAQCQSEL